MARWFLVWTMAACGGNQETFRPDDGDDDDDVVVGDDDDDGRPPAGLDCDVPFETPAPGGEGSGACVTQVIQCGDTVRGTNAGGSTHFGSGPDEPFGTCAGSASQTNDLDGPERVYELQLPEETRSLHVELGSCEKSLLLWYQGAACTTNDVSCRYPIYGTYYDQYDDVLLADARVIYFVVEGVKNDGGNFELTVDCYE